VTIVGAHANGFPKELYEPLWDEMLLRAKENGFRIRGICIADVSNQGASGILNENKMGDDPSWDDHPRDLLHMINTFRDQMPRPLIGVGHSMGGCHLVNLSLIHPRLLSTLVLMDPVIQKFASNPTGPSPAQASTYRRDLWPSREAAAATFKKSKFYQTWDDRVLQRWVTHGLRELPSPIYPDDSSKQGQDRQVTLSTTKHQEVFTFLRPNFIGLRDGEKAIVDRSTHADLDPTGPNVYPFYRPEPLRTFHNLPYLRPSVLYIFGGKSPMSQLPHRKEKMDSTGTGVGGSGGTKEGRVREVVLEEIGHLVAMEAVEACADAATSWIGKEMGRWRDEERKFREEWSKKGILEKQVVSEEWKRMIGGPLRVKEVKRDGKL